jgi:hypothetical protein
MGALISAKAIPPFTSALKPNNQRYQNLLSKVQAA